MKHQEIKKIFYNYGADIEWVDSLAKQLDGRIEGNNILVPDTIHTGNRYFLNCGEGIVVQYLDITYNTDMQIIIKNKKNDFIGIYYNLSDRNSKLTLNSISNDIGESSYNLSLIDSSLEFQYNIKAGLNAFVVCIFIKKELIKNYTQKYNILHNRMKTILDPAENHSVIFDRMSNESYHILADLRRFKVGEKLFDLNLTATVHLLISDYLLKLSNKKIITLQVNQSDLSSIISSKQFLIKNLQNAYPGNTILAKKHNMSESKFKMLFKKITGTTPNSFFMDNKLILSKKLLEEKQLSISEISNKFNFTNPSYFAEKFKKKFGITPKKFTQQL